MLILQHQSSLVKKISPVILLPDACGRNKGGTPRLLDIITPVPLVQPVDYCLTLAPLFPRLVRIDHHLPDIPVALDKFLHFLLSPDH